MPRQRHRAANRGNHRAGHCERTSVTARTAKPLERTVLRAVLSALAIHPSVAWAVRMNVGAFNNGAGNYVRVGFVGCADVIGQLRDGRFLAVEVKRPGGKVTDDQAAFLARVTKYGGVGFVAFGVDDVMRQVPKL